LRELTNRLGHLESFLRNQEVRPDALTLADVGPIILDTPTQCTSEATVTNTTNDNDSLHQYPDLHVSNDIRYEEVELQEGLGLETLSHQDHQPHISTEEELSNNTIRLSTKQRKAMEKALALAKQCSQASPFVDNDQFWGSDENDAALFELRSFDIISVMMQCKSSTSVLLANIPSNYSHRRCGRCARAFDSILPRIYPARISKSNGVGFIAA
jgi:hypothetical protein